MKPQLILMMGYPRSGKTTRALEMGHPIVSADAIRLALHGQPFIESAEPYVHAIERTMVEALFLTGHTHVVLDSCHNRRKRRDPWKDERWQRTYCVMHVSPTICIGRVRAVGGPDEERLVKTINRMHKQREVLQDGEFDHEEG